MNLREDKHWSYGSFTFLRDARGQRPFVAYAPVQTDKTKEALIELRKELHGILSDRPPTADELARAQVGAHAHAAGELGDDGRRRGGRSATSSPSVSTTATSTPMPTGSGPRPQRRSRAAAKEIIHPDRLVWVVVGDRSKIEAGIRELEAGRDPVSSTRTASRSAPRESRTAPGRAAPIGAILMLLPSEDAAAQRRTQEGIFSMPFQAGPRSGRNFENNSWMVGGQARRLVGQARSSSGPAATCTSSGARRWRGSSTATPRSGSATTAPSTPEGASRGSIRLTGHRNRLQSARGPQLGRTLGEGQRISSSFAGPSSTTTRPSNSCSASYTGCDRETLMTTRTATAGTTSTATATWEGGLVQRQGPVQRRVRRVPGQLLVQHPVRGRQRHQSRGADRGGARRRASAWRLSAGLEKAGTPATRITTTASCTIEQGGRRLPDHADAARGAG